MCVCGCEWCKNNKATYCFPIGRLVRFVFGEAKVLSDVASPETGLLSRSRRDVYMYDHH